MWIKKQISKTLSCKWPEHTSSLNFEFKHFQVVFFLITQRTFEGHFTLNQFSDSAHHDRRDRYNKDTKEEGKWDCFFNDLPV